MKNNIVKLTISRNDEYGSIIKQIYFNENSDNVNEIEELLKFLDENTGEYNIFIDHFIRLWESK